MSDTTTIAETIEKFFVNNADGSLYYSKGPDMYHFGKVFVELYGTTFYELPPLTEISIDHIFTSKIQSIHNRILKHIYQTECGINNAVHDKMRNSYILQMKNLEFYKCLVDDIIIRYSLPIDVNACYNFIMQELIPTFTEFDKKMQQSINILRSIIKEVNDTIHSNIHK